MAIITKAPRGTEDKLPANIYQWQTIEKVIGETAQAYGCKEIRTPTFEHTALFQRGVGDTTDIVQKEMYTFLDKKGRSITLKPEGTAGAVRAAIEHGLVNAALPLKLYYFTNCFRYEAPQSGRLREFKQFGVEVLGADSPLADAEMILLVADILERLGLKDVKLHINSIGCPECRKTYLDALREYFTPYRDTLCETCLVRLERNPMRLLDCKSETCSAIAKDAPAITDYLCEDCNRQFSELKSALDLQNISYEVNPRIVRGLDYYTNTVFEFISTNIGSQGTICGGGRYNGLVSELGGPNMSGIGFAMGLERLIMVMQAEKCGFLAEKACDLYIAGMDSDSRMYSTKLVRELRSLGFWAENDLAGRGLKAQMKYADKLNARYSMVLGGDEMQSKRAILKNMQSGEKHEVDISDGFGERISTLLMELSI